MTPAEWQPLLKVGLEIGFLLAMLVATFRDLAAWSLPNWLTLAVALGFLPWAWASGFGWPDLGYALLAAALVLALGFGL